MANIANPNIPQRHDQRFFTGPIGNGTVITSPVYIDDLPTTNPNVAGQLWNNSGVVTESAG